MGKTGTNGFWNKWNFAWWRMNLLKRFSLFETQTLFQEVVVNKIGNKKVSEDKHPIMSLMKNNTYEVIDVFDADKEGG